MALLPILIYPDKRLKLVADPVEKVDDEIRQLITNMFETMYESQGVGLAAIQVDVQKRIFTMDTSRDKSTPIAFINPVIVEKIGETTWEEGCLSFPGVYAKVKRAEEVVVEFVNENNEPQKLHLKELDAICVQHEIDHLDGITFFDHLSNLKRERLKKKLKELQEKSL